MRTFIPDKKFWRIGVYQWTKQTTVLCNLNSIKKRNSEVNNKENKRNVMVGLRSSEYGDWKVGEWGIQEMSNGVQMDI